MYHQEKLCRAKKNFLAFSAIFKTQNERVNNEDQVTNDIFNFLWHTISSSCFYELQICSKPDKIQNKTFVMPKTLPKSALPIPERSAPVSFDNFINAVNIAKV